MKSNQYPGILVTAWLCAVAVAAVMGLGPRAHAEENDVGYRLADGERVRIQSPAIKEASGLAVSRRGEGFLWVINDSGARPELHLVETTGRYRGRIVLEGAVNHDWEDLSSFVLNGTSYLMVADTGDNEAKRKSCVLHVLREPELPPDGRSLECGVRAEWEIRFCYESGPRDCESVAVDAASGKILLLSKRDAPAQLFELPLKPAVATGIQTARSITSVRIKAAGNLIPFATQPTGLDLSSDHSLAAVLTYQGVYLFSRKPGEPWADAFARDPQPLASHRLPQAEAIAFSRDGENLWVAPEGRNPVLACYRRIRSGKAD